jgi:hypothetical protein
VVASGVRLAFRRPCGHTSRDRAGTEKPSSCVWRARRRAGAIPTPTRSEDRPQNHDEREVPVLPTSLTGRVGGHICQAVTFVLVVCAGRQEATSRLRAREEDRCEPVLNERPDKQGRKPGCPLL